LHAGAAIVLRIRSYRALHWRRVCSLLTLYASRPIS